MNKYSRVCIFCGSEQSVIESNFCKECKCEYNDCKKMKIYGYTCELHRCCSCLIECVRKNSSYCFDCAKQKL